MWDMEIKDNYVAILKLKSKFKYVDFDLNY
jgi:hypothetical protein